METAAIYQALLQEGGCLLRKGDELFLAYKPIRCFRCDPGPGSWEALTSFIESCQHPAVGFIGYEMGAWADPDYPLPFHPSQYPSTVFYEVEGWQPIVSAPKRDVCVSLSFLKGSDSYAQYIHKIEAIREWIAQGSVYQVNLSQEFTFSHRQQDPLEVFLKLYQMNPASYAAYLNCGSFTIGSLSPELFVKREKGVLLTRPIKGTSPRGKDERQDEIFRSQLIKSEKDRAELLMITDLMRHDLTRICIPKSVCVEKLWECETHRDVFHLVSTLTGISHRPAMEIVRTLFPAGSITGCPKRAAMEKIFAIEQRPRGAYTGAIGVFDPIGDFSLNVAIRTYAMDSSKLQVQLGGAIVYDSCPDLEYAETLHKGRSFFEAFDSEFLVRRT